MPMSDFFDHMKQCLQCSDAVQYDTIEPCTEGQKLYDKNKSPNIGLLGMEPIRSQSK